MLFLISDNSFAIAVCSVCALAVPLILFFVLKKRSRVSSSEPFWAGVITFIVFALVLEKLVLLILGKTPFWNSMPFMARVILTGLLAGFFEESGCLISMKVSEYIEEKRRMKAGHEQSGEGKNDIMGAIRTNLDEVREGRDHALMHGLGHGGAVVIVFGLIMLFNLVYAVLRPDAPGSGVSFSAPAANLIHSALTSYRGVSVLNIVMSLFEEICALAIHISLAVLVWFSLQGGKNRIYFFLSILLHALSDVLIEIFLESGLSHTMCLLAYLGLTLAIVGFTWGVWNSLEKKEIMKILEAKIEEQK